MNHLDTQASTLSQTFRETLKGAFFFLLFGVFPILVLQYARQKIDELEIAKKINNSKLNHERILGKIKQADDNAKMIGRSIKLVTDRIFGLKNRSEQVWQINCLKKAFPQAFDLFIYDGEGKLIPELSSNRYPRKAMEFALEGLLEFAANGKSKPGKVGIFKNIVGLQDLPGVLKKKEEVIKLGNRKLDSHFCWNHTEEVSTVQKTMAPHAYIALLHSHNFDKDKALNYSIKWVNARFRYLQAGTVDLDAKSNSGYFPPELAILPDLKLCLLSTERKYENSFVHKGYFCTFTRNSPTRFLVITQRVPVFFSHSFKLALNIFCIFWLLFVFRNLPLGNRQLQGGITAKLVFLFLFSIGLPSLLLMIGGYYALKDHANVMQQDLENKIIGKLKLFDEKYPDELENLAAYLRSYVMKAQHRENFAEILDLLKETRTKKNLFMHGLLLDEKGTELFSLHEDQSSAGQKNKKIVILVAREMLSRLNKSMKVDSGTLMMEATEDFVTSVLGGRNFDFNLLIKNMGEFIPMAFGQEGSYLFADVIFDDQGKARYACIFVANRPVLARHYIKKNIDSLSAQEDFSWKVNLYGVTPYSGRVLTTPQLRNKIVQLAKNMMARNAPVKEVVASGSEEELWYAQRGANLEDFALVAKTSLQPLKDEIRRKWFLLVMLALTILFIAAMIGITLSNQFLKPIDNLTLGLKAIEKRQFDVKVPIHSQDELGQLSQLLNSVLEGMKDLEVASIVQSSLFPSDMLVEKEIEIFGQSRAMTDIGGDYFDFFVADGSRIIGLVGDVSGHGVSAALIMGMAKFAFTTAEAYNRPLTDTLASFNHFLIRNIKRKKMMTMFLYSLNTETYELEYANAGHNPPIYWNYRSKTCSKIAMDSFPLGIRAKSKYSKSSMKLEPGDKILMYTDGLVEATGKNGKQLGYELAIEWFKQCADYGTRDSVEFLFRNFDEQTENKPAEDDISLIVLGRKPL
ncbi:MAG: hypothetical protein Kow0029_05700 [Candidatus Rifleibacteriota bacterium]